MNRLKAMMRESRENSFLLAFSLFLVEHLGWTIVGAIDWIGVYLSLAGLRDSLITRRQPTTNMVPGGGAFSVLDSTLFSAVLNYGRSCLTFFLSFFLILLFSYCLFG